MGKEDGEGAGQGAGEVSVVGQTDGVEMEVGAEGPAAAEHTGGHAFEGVVGGEEEGGKDAWEVEGRGC